MWQVEDTVGSLGGDLEEVGSRWGNGEGVGLEIGMPQEFGRVAGNAMVPEVHENIPSCLININLCTPFSFCVLIQQLTQFQLFIQVSFSIVITKIDPVCSQS